MNTEIEAKFLNIDRDEMRRLLAAAGYDCTQPDYLMRRMVFDTPATGKGSWARVRDEGSKVTVTYKRTLDMSRVDGTEEIEIIVDSFDEAAKLLSAFGLTRKSYQETRREIWHKGAVEVVIDEWPGAPCFIEIEAATEGLVRDAANELGFDWALALFGPVGVVYETVGISHLAINQAPLLTFDNLEDIAALKDFHAA